jgi:hypothetical protein
MFENGNHVSQELLKPHATVAEDLFPRNYLLGSVMEGTRRKEEQFEVQRQCGIATSIY